MFSVLQRQSTYWLNADFQMMIALLQKRLVRCSIVSLDLPYIQLKSKANEHKSVKKLICNKLYKNSKCIRCTWFKNTDKSMMLTSGQARMLSSSQLHTKLWFGNLACRLLYYQ